MGGPLRDDAKIWDPSKPWCHTAGPEQADPTPADLHAPGSPAPGGHEDVGSVRTRGPRETERRTGKAIFDGDPRRIWKEIDFPGTVRRCG